MSYSIPPSDEAARSAAHARWAACAHPLGSLGLLETALEDIAALTGSADIALKPRTLVVFCADNGVVARGVTQTGSAVTGVVARALAAGASTANQMAALADCRVLPVDVGMRDFAPCPGVLDRRVGNSTADITRGPAMTRAQAEQAVRIGIQLAAAEKARGTHLLAAGEMGIGNTTTAAAVASALLDLTPEDAVGRGAGLSDEGLARKRAAVRAALELNEPDKTDPLDVLAKVGGFDIAGLCGLYLGGAIYRLPVVMDGAIGAAAALCAVRLAPAAGRAILASHLSAEPVGARPLAALGKRPLITAGLRLGEGTGALAALPLLDMALAVYEQGSTFADYGIPPYEPLGGETCSP